MDQLDLRQHFPAIIFNGRLRNDGVQHDLGHHDTRLAYRCQFGISKFGERNVVDSGDRDLSGDIQIFQMRRPEDTNGEDIDVILTDKQNGLNRRHR